jgi:two-component system response regulator GlrR
MSVTKTFHRPSAFGPLGVVLRVTNRPSRPREFRLRTGSCILGAGADADLIIGDETVSRQHLELSLVPEGVRIRDLSSHNGSWYVGQRIREGILAAGSTVRLGSAELRIEPDRELLESEPTTEEASYGELVGRSEGMRKLFGLLQRIEASLANVVVEGESGAGKELIARAIHKHSAVADGPFVTVNCGALDRALVRSELFGHKRGSFTGALDNRQGAFEAASGGTLFLDEVGELPLEVQPMLLRALELGVITRVGENIDRRVNVRIVAATHRNLLAETRSGRFREDLFFRLMVVQLRVPPLRERVEDLPLLTARLGAAFGLSELPEAVEQELAARTWPGNVRELKNAIHAYSVLGTLPERHSARDEEFGDVLQRMLDLNVPYAEQKERLLKRFLRIYLEALLAHTGGNKSEAARISGLERSYLNKVANQLLERADGEFELGKK